MAITFKCKEPGCNKEVTYEYEPIEGTLEVKEQANKPSAVYLTCEDGHTYPYPSSIQEGGSHA